MKIRFTKKAFAIALSCILIGTIGNVRYNFDKALPKNTKIEKQMTIKKVK